MPEWVHLLPAGEVRTQDGRGPYRVADVAALMAASLPAGGKLVLDENHSTDLAAPKGAPAPAMGWIVELQARADGIWGRVDWTDAGRRLAGDRAYSGISPVIAYRKNGTIDAILRASLTNKPNLAGLQSLHQEDEDMSLKNRLLEALGLGSDADEDAIVAAVSANTTATALQAALSPIAQAAGLAADADAAAVLAGVQGLATRAGAGDQDDVITGLQSELTAVTTRLNALTEAGARSKAEAFVDGAIAAGHVGVKPLRDRYIALHMKDAAEAEALINGLPKLQGGSIVPAGQPKAEPGQLGTADRQVIALMGLDPEEYKKVLAAEAITEETL